jgi:hypothetical protein
MAVVRVYCEIVSGIFPDIGKNTGNFHTFPTYFTRHQAVTPYFLTPFHLLRITLEFLTGNYQGIHQRQKLWSRAI